MKKCIVCKRELTPKSVYGGFMGFSYRLFFRSKGWEELRYCQKCRDRLYYARGLNGKNN